MNSGYFNNNGSWKKATSVHVNKNGSWQEANILFAAKDGKWVDVVSNELNDDQIKIDSVSSRSGSVYQADLIFKGSNMKQYPEPSPSTYTFYTLNKNLTDSLDNFTNLRLSSGTANFTTGDDLGIRLDKTLQQWIVSPSDYDIRGLFGTGISKYVLFGMQYKTKSASTGTKTYLFDAKSANGRFSIYLESGNLYVSWFNNTTTNVQMIPNVNTTHDIWHGFYFLHTVGSSTATLVTDLGQSVQINCLWFSAVVGETFTIGYGIDGSPSYADIIVRSVFLRNAAFTTIDIANDLINPNSKMSLCVKPYPSGTEQVLDNVLSCSLDGTNSTISIPNIADGNYLFRLKRGSQYSNYRFYTVKSPTYSTTPLYMDSGNITKKTVTNNFIVGHKRWGGNSGGIIQENVMVENGLIKIRTCGDNYSGPLLGVDEKGNRTSANKCIGGCIVTKDSYGPGFYKIEAKLPSMVGACTAIWTFHYEEAPINTPLSDSIISDGLGVSGSLENGYYVVRNHEIDIEVPTALQSNPNQEDVSYTNARFNSWRGELGAGYTADTVNHGVTLNDGQYHELGFDWQLLPSPKIDFYIDGVLRHTITTNVPDIPGKLWIGIWFPRGSVGNRWAGFPANYDEDYMYIRKISIVPGSTSGVRNICETFPNDGFRPVL